MAKKKTVETALVLRTCDASLRSHKGFQWPNGIGAVVEAPDWKETNACGNGLHGWLHGAGDSSASSSVGQADAKWMVVEVILADVVMLGGKCKFPRCTIRHIGDKKSATDFLLANEPRAKNVAVIGATVSVGEGLVALTGNYGTSTSGDGGTSTSGDGGTSTSGNYGTSTSGYRGTSTSGYRGTSTSGDGGTSTSGDGGTSTSGDGGTSTSGNYGTSTSGDGGTSTSGNYGTSTSGDGGTSMAGEKGEIRIRYWDARAERYRTAVGYVGEDGIKPNTKYRLNDKQQFEEVKE